MQKEDTVGNFLSEEGRSLLRHQCTTQKKKTLQTAGPRTPLFLVTPTQKALGGPRRPLGNVLWLSLINRLVLVLPVAFSLNARSRKRPLAAGSAEPVCAVRAECCWPFHMEIDATERSQLPNN